MNLKQQLRELANKQCDRNTTQLCETLRKLAFDRASSGYSNLGYTVDMPVNWTAVKAYFSSQGIKVETNAYGVLLSW